MVEEIAGLPEKEGSPVFYLALTGVRRVGICHRIISVKREEASVFSYPPQGPPRRSVMARMFTAPLACILMFSFLAVLTAPAPVRAVTTYEFTATSQSIYATTFTLLYDDLDGNGLFSLNELVTDSFSGLWYSGHFYTKINGVPLNSLVNDFSYSPLTAGNQYGFWGVVSDDNWYTQPWTSEFAESQVAVPVPAAVVLLGSGLIGLAGWRRFRKG
jgi:hypothetical protein